MKENFQEQTKIKNNTNLTMSDLEPNKSVNVEKEMLKQEGGYEIFFTKDPKYLDQYYELRHQAYVEDNGWANYDGKRNKFDQMGHIVVTTKNDAVVGGLRLSFSSDFEYLSNEIPGTQYDYHKFISKYDSTPNLLISEISAVVLEKSNRNTIATQAMLELALKKSIQKGCHYSFAVSVITAARYYRTLLRNIGHDLEILINFPWERKGMFNFDRMFLMYTNLKKSKN